MNSIQTIGIIGKGSMGKIMKGIINNSGKKWNVRMWSHTDSRNVLKKVASSNVVILAVPIRSFEEAVSTSIPYLQKGALIVDVCSVKVYPKKILQKKLPKTCDILLTHPMFGPATLKAQKGSYTDLTLVAEEVRDTHNRISEFLQIFSLAGIRIVEMDAKTHDTLTAQFQFTAHILAHTLSQVPFPKTDIDTVSVSHIHEFRKRIQTEHFDLVEDMHVYNPYAKKQLVSIQKSFATVISTIQKP